MATDQPVPVGTDLAEYVLANARQIIRRDFRDGDRFADEQHVAETADSLTRLAAFTGRAA